MLKILYGLAALALGIVISVTLVRIAVTHETGHEEVAAAATLFPDYVAQLNDYYKSYENRRDHSTRPLNVTFCQWTSRRIVLPATASGPIKKMCVPGLSIISTPAT